MTHVIGIKTKKSVILIADQAVTIEGAAVNEPIQPISAFEERHIFVPGRSVSQQVLKIYSIGKTVVSLCGNYEHASEVVEKFRTLVTYN